MFKIVCRVRPKLPELQKPRLNVAYDVCKNVYGVTLILANGFDLTVEMEVEIFWNTASAIYRAFAHPIASARGRRKSNTANCSAVICGWALRSILEPASM